ncbi:myosin heavy chain, partial [Reticulomyxa filosa]
HEDKKPKKKDYLKKHREEIFAEISKAREESEVMTKEDADANTDADANANDDEEVWTKASSYTQSDLEMLRKTTETVSMRELKKQQEEEEGQTPLQMQVQVQSQQQQQEKEKEKDLKVSKDQAIDRMDLTDDIESVEQQVVQVLDEEEIAKAKLRRKTIQMQSKHVQAKHNKDRKLTDFQDDMGENQTRLLGLF